MLPTVARAIRANALIETKIGGILGGMGIGSGVIMRIENGSAPILTNRHVVDPEFEVQRGGAGKAGPAGRPLAGQAHWPAAHPGRVVWIAPDDIDLALVRVAADGKGAQSPPGAAIPNYRRQRRFHRWQSRAPRLDAYPRQHFAARSAEARRREVHVIQTDAV